MTTHTIYAHFQAKPGNEDLVHKILSGLVQPTRQEPGCLHYEFYQSLDDKAKIILHEQWVDAAAHDIHMQMPYVQAWQVRKKELLSDYFDVVLNNT